MMTSILYTCGCGNTDKFAQDAFKILFPRAEIPPVQHQLVLPPTDDIAKIVQALKADKKRKFAYLFRYDDNHTETWDLIKGKQVF